MQPRRFCANTRAIVTGWPASAPICLRRTLCGNSQSIHADRRRARKQIESASRPIGSPAGPRACRPHEAPHNRNETSAARAALVRQRDRVFSRTRATHRSRLQRTAVFGAGMRSDNCMTTAFGRMLGAHFGVPRCESWPDALHGVRRADGFDGSGAHDTMTVPGFEHETLQCPACGAIERKLVFTRRPNETAVPSPLPPPPVLSCSHQPVPSCPQPEGIAPAPAWSRAVEELRSLQADLHQRAGEIKTGLHVQFNRKPARNHREPPPADSSADGRFKDFAWKSARALRAQLRKRSSPPGRGRTKQQAIQPSPEAIQQFNQFWESLVPGINLPEAPAEVPLASAGPAPLPRSLSLVAVERLEAASTAGRAILLLRGTQQMG